MAFYRCSVQQSGGGGSGDGNDYVSYINGTDVEYFKLTLPILNNSLTNMGISGSTFNGKVHIGNNIKSIASAFTYLSNYNQPTTLPDSVEDARSAFNGCVKLNSLITIPDSVNYMMNMFYSCSNFNQPVHLSNGANDFSYLFAFCYEYNQPIHIPYSAKMASNMLKSCNKFNSPITFDVNTNLYTLDNAFINCSNYNLPFRAPWNCRIFNYAFANCTNFNQPLLFSFENMNLASIVCGNMLANCTNFNSPVLFNVSNTNIIFGLTVTQAFYNCPNMGSDIILATGRNMTTASDTSLSFKSMLGLKNKTKRVNVYINNVAQITRITNASSIVGAAVTWTATTNGYYNSTFNVYLLNNVNDGMNKFNDYWYNLYGEYPVY